MDLSPFHSPPHILGVSEGEGVVWSLARDNASLAPDSLCHTSVPTEEHDVPRTVPSHPGPAGSTAVSPWAEFRLE